MNLPNGGHVERPPLLDQSTGHMPHVAPKESGAWALSIYLHIWLGRGGCLAPNLLGPGPRARGRGPGPGAGARGPGPGAWGPGPWARGGTLVQANLSIGPGPRAPKP